MIIPNAGPPGIAELVKVGDRVRHGNTKQWGTVLEVKPVAPGYAELRVDREQHTAHGDAGIAGQGWWGTYHVDQHDPAPSATEAG